MQKIILLLLIPILSLSHLRAQYKSKSILSEGEFYKIKIQSSGAYQIDQNWLSQNTTLDVNGLNPEHIKIYGTNGGLLPLDNDIPRIDDLEEFPIYGVGLSDGSMDAGDKIIFYAEGPDLTRVTNTGLTYDKNIYDTNSYVFLTLSNSNSKKISLASPVSTSSYTPYSETLHRHENEVLNLLGQFGSTQGSGKMWFGETFTNEPEQNFTSSFSDIKGIAGTQGTINCRFASRSPSSSRVQLNVNNSEYTRDLRSVDLGEIETTYARLGIFRDTFILTNGVPNINIKYIANAANSEAWLDYIELIVKEEIQINSAPMLLYDRDAMNDQVAGFEFQDPGTGTKLWDITNITEVRELELNRSGGQARFGYDTSDGQKMFFLFNENTQINIPEMEGVISNQNIHGLEDVNMVIISHPDFMDAAQMLADHRASNDGLLVEVVNIFEVYNEFAGGRQDPIAIRDMCRMLWRTRSEFKYLLLLGDASYDYRGIVPNLDYQNYVPTYQTDESLYPINAFPSDDFFGLLSDDEGSNQMAGRMDIGVGRLPAGTATEAEDMIKKIIRYDNGDKRFGEWRTNIGFAADDVDKSFDTTHLIDADNIAETTQDEHPCLVQQKVYFDSFVQEATPGGARYPDANKAITDNIFQGQLVFNYLGHGGPKGLSQERVLQIRDVRNWSNIDKLPVFITATCSFTGFDEPSFVSAGEHLMLNPSGGAVALFTTVRAVFADSNRRLTENIYETMFDRIDGVPKRLGDILVDSQNGIATTNTRKFCLIGDPSMTLALPTHNIVVNEFSGQEIDSIRIDTIGSLSRGSVSGEIVSFRDSTIISSFNGRIDMTIYDKESEGQTLVNDGVGPSLSFKVNKNILYRGSASVTNGKFTVDFVLPKDINFEFGPGSIHFYATDETSTDAIGCYNNIIVGGSSPIVIEDNEGPEIDIFFNDKSFQSGGKVNTTPILIVDLEDENGINLSSSSIGHDITAALEDQNGDKIVLNEFFSPTMDKTGSGTVTYQMGELEPGLHKIYLKAWDILNNSSEEMSEFLVFESEEGFIENVFNYPNPFSTSTEFSFEHDLISTNLDIRIDIYTISGKLIKTIESEQFSSGSRVDNILWNARDDYGGKLAKGIYLYKINVVAPELDVRRESDFMKMVILN